MLKLAVPSKGRLMEQCFDWFADHGVRLSRSGSDREYAGRVEGVENLRLQLLSAGEIPRELGAGRIDLGVTGTDLVREKLAGWRSVVTELAPMGFGHADLVLAVPAKYHRLVRAWLSAHEVADYQLVDSQGATEGTVANLTAEAIADITSSGETLRANHLKILGEPPILQSQATLFASRSADAGEVAGFVRLLGL